MTRPPYATFSATGEGAGFHRSYDRVLGRWPVAVTGVDLPSEYGTTHVNVCGPVDAPPVVLLPGAGATSTVWFANVAALAQRYRVHAVDLMGDAGRSVADGLSLRSVDDLMRWLDTVTRSAGGRDVHLVGHSYGAMIALTYALREPDRVRKLVLLDPNSCFTGMRAAYLARAVPLLARPTDKRERAFVRWETDGREVNADWLDLLARGAASFPKSRTVVPRRPGRRALEQLAVDTTVILAADSKVHDSRHLAAHLARSLPQLRTVVVDGATHHTMPMSPATEVNDALLDALAPR